MSIFNAELIKFARDTVARQAAIEKGAFTDTAALAGGGGAPPGADPMAGAMPPMPPMGPDPAAGGAPPPGDPMAGGAPPPPIADPAAAGGGGGMTPEDVKMIVEQVMAAGGGAAGGKGDKMKVDVNTEIYQLKKMMTMLFNNLGIEVPANMLLGDPAQDPSIPASDAAKDPASAAAAQGSAISPIAGIEGASPALAGGGGAPPMGGGGPPMGGGEKAGEAWTVDTAKAECGQEISRSLVQQSNKAAALAQQLRAIGQQYAA